MTFDKKWAFQGESVSKEDVLRELGHPAQWGRAQREHEFEICLVPGESELRLGAIKGFPGRIGYLEFLESEFEKPFGYDTGLVTDHENELILIAERRDIEPELAKYKTLLAQYEQDPEQIARYVFDMTRWISFKIEMELLIHDIDSTGDSEIDEALRKKDEEDRRNMALLGQRIAEYKQKFFELTGKHPEPHNETD